METSRIPNRTAAVAVGLSLPAPRVDAPFLPGRLSFWTRSLADSALMTPDERLATFGRLFATAIKRRRARMASFREDRPEHVVIPSSHDRSAGFDRFVAAKAATEVAPTAFRNGAPHESEFCSRIARPTSSVAPCRVEAGIGSAGPP